MIVVVQGTRNFDDYTVFLRAMGTALSSLEDGDTEFLIYSCGPHRINEMSLEFSNISERTLKSRGVKIRTVKVPIGWVENNIDKVDYLAFFSIPKEPVSKLVDLADAKDVEVGVYRY